MNFSFVGPSFICSPVDIITFCIFSFMILEVYIHLLHFWVALGSSALQGQISSERLITFNLKMKCQRAVFSEENNQLCNLC